MKVLNFLGRRIIIKVESISKNSDVKTSVLKDKFFERILFLILLIIIFAFISKADLLDTIYVEGDILKEDIVSPLTVEYLDTISKEKMINARTKSTPKIYKINVDIERRVYEDLDIYFEKIKSIDSKISENEILKFMSDTDVILDAENFKTILSLNVQEKLKLKEKIKEKLKSIYGKGVRADTDYIEQLKEEAEIEFINYEMELFMQFIEPNEFYDDEATQEAIKENVLKIKDTKIKINAGDIILKKGEKISKESLIKLKNTGIYDIYSNLQMILGIVLYFLAVFVLFGTLAYKYIKREINENKIYYSTMIALLIMFVIAKLLHLNYIYIFPFGAMVLLLGIIANERYSLIVSIVSLLSIYAYEGFNQKFFLINLLELMVGIMFIKNIKNRTTIINAGIIMGITKTMAMLAMNITTGVEFVQNIVYLVEILSSGILAGMITIALLPYFENTFNILTDIKLLELGDFSHPLLRELVLRAPGTFNHSILVANLAENAAEAIGANATFVRVASYYHDIGKIKRPNFFVENQKDTRNPHEGLNPYLSSLVITSHTKDGEEIAKKYKIPKEIRDVMKEHQGTTLLAYFYNKAKKETGEVNEVDFRYEGPKPTTKESAVIMLADSIEAAVRSLDDKNPVAIENMIRKIINGKIDDGQLSQAELTFKDIDIIIATFVKVVQGIHHSRIKYPDVKK